MQNSAMFWVGATTFVLFTVTLMAAVNVSFNWVFYITVLGQLMIIYMVYKVLTDSYKTSKTFEDFYEDAPFRQ
ncbi:hypothetical protein [Eudoraea chungangensis]|uniref:hypothetical protein n=1 Tax=Eudoraea chungangensis TaxID=1481905 RepID=UPI0023EDDF81|nr:hypothetical protein [Eudoraea chungangensis]